MKRMLLLAVFGILTGCADTPQNRQLWQGIGSGMNSAADNMNRQTEQMKQQMHEQNLQNSRQNQYQPPRTTNCTTRYDRYSKQYETSCY